MLWLNIKRILKSGFVSFWRNGVVSLSAVLVMIITLFIISTVVFSGVILNHTMLGLKNSVDINVNIATGTIEEDIMSLKSQIESLPEVDYVEYISQEKALENYKEIHKNDQNMLSALEEFNENPLGAILNIKAKEPSQYESIQLFLDQNYQVSESLSIIESINYGRKKEAIDKLDSIINASEKFGFILTVLFIFLSIIITLNTVRLIMFISKDEIKVMNLVGAGRFYISGPFLVSGAMYGFISAISVAIILYPATYYFTPQISPIFFNFDLFAYYLQNFGQLFLILVASGILLGAISSLFAINRYLNSR